MSWRLLSGFKLTLSYALPSFYNQRYCSFNPPHGYNLVIKLDGGIDAASQNQGQNITLVVPPPSSNAQTSIEAMTFGPSCLRRFRGYNCKIYIAYVISPTVVVSFIVQVQPSWRHQSSVSDSLCSISPCVDDGNQISTHQGISHMSSFRIPWNI